MTKSRSCRRWIRSFANPIACSVTDEDEDEDDEDEEDFDQDYASDQSAAGTGFIDDEAEEGSDDSDEEMEE